MAQSIVNIFASSLNDNVEKSKFGMSIGKANAYYYNCDILEPIGDDPIFMHLGDFSLEIHASQDAKPKSLSL